MKKVQVWMDRLRFLPGRKVVPAPEQPGSMDEFYKNGGFDFLYSQEELSHYMVILGYIRYFGKQPAILDVGCGEGRLAELLDRHAYQDYQGIDISSVAIQRAQKKKLPKARFSVADFQTWTPDRSYDLILFCESLYYVQQPQEVVGQYIPYLKKGGYMIISVYRFLDQERVWNSIDQRLKICAEDTLQNLHGTWDMRVYSKGNNPGS
jgi:2-polyprenyl-3-methyl-5-hydroxy-6-metoxy-1,4-benzoquinol methylase